MIRITAHPTDKAILFLRVDYEHNDAIGSFAPAHRQSDLGRDVFLMEADKMDALRSWAKYNAVHLLDETRRTGESTKPLECGNVIATWEAEDGRLIEEQCRAAYTAGRLPKVCGSCGQAANPVIFEESEPIIGVRCEVCSRVNHGGPAYCLECGSPMPSRRLRAPAVKVSGEPAPLGQAIDELAKGWGI
jgi:hypothetical protein